MSSRRRAERALVIGIDGGMLSLAERFMREGVMPNLKRLADGGTGTEALPSIPVDTPTNWTTIATGAEPATHGIQSFTAHRAGEALDAGERDPSRNKHATSVNAEFFWAAAERQGKRACVINYPTGWPGRGERQVVVGGLTPGGDPWRLAKPRVYATGAPQAVLLDLPTAQIQHTPLSLAPAEGWRGAVASRAPALETTIQVRGGDWAETLHLLVTAGGGDGAGYDRVTIAAARDLGQRLATLAAGEWSPWLLRDFGGLRVVFRFKLAALSKDARHLELYCTDVFRAEGWTHPESLAPEIVAQVGPYVEGLECPYVPVDEERRPYGPINVSVPITLEQARFQATWMADTAAHLLHKHGWDVLFLHYHLIDAINHTFLGYLDPEFPYTTPERTRQTWEIYRESYRVVDQLIGGLVEGCVDDSTVVVVTSDHAALPCWRYVSIVRALHNAQLLEYAWDPETGRFTVDLSRSKAVPYLDPQHIWVNLEGREPGGIVPRHRYEQVRERILEALWDIRDPDTGERPVQLACRREDLALRGRSEDRVGDVLYFLKPGYSTWDGMLESLRFGRLGPERLAGGVVGPSELVVGHHTPFLPTARYKEFMNSAMTYFRGPGIRSGYRRQVPIRLKDIAPTLSRLMGLEGPAQAEGSVLWDVLESR